MQMTVKEVAKFLGVAEKLVFKWVDAGAIPVYRVNGEYRFNRTEVLEWAQTKQLNVSTERYKTDGEGHILPSVAAALECGGILRGIAGADKAAALKSMVDALPLPEGTDRVTLLELILARERLGSTALGKGIAIPHVRNPIVLRVDSPRITLCFLEKAIDFEAPDGQPVDALFWMVCPTVNAHTHMLARLAAVVTDPSFQTLLRRKAPSEEILDEVRRIESANRSKEAG